MTDNQLRSLSKTDLLKIIRELEIELQHLTEKNADAEKSVEEIKSYFKIMLMSDYAKDDQTDTCENTESRIIGNDEPAFLLPELTERQSIAKLDRIYEIEEHLEQMMKDHLAMREKMLTKATAI